MDSGIASSLSSHVNLTSAPEAGNAVILSTNQPDLSSAHLTQHPVSVGNVTHMLSSLSHPISSHNTVVCDLQAATKSNQNSHMVAAPAVSVPEGGTVDTNMSYNNNIGQPVMFILNQDNMSNTSTNTTTAVAPSKIQTVMVQNPLISDMYQLQNNFSSIYALAQANLVAQTQQDIAKQLINQTQESILHQPQTPQPLLPSKLQQDQVQVEDNTSKYLDLDSTSKSLQKPEQPMWETKQVIVEKVSKMAEEKVFKTYTCDTEKCGRKFSSLGHLRNHKAMHNREKPLECTYEGCQRKFTWPAHLKYHMLTHGETRNYCCTVEGCGKTFYTSQRLKVHMRTHTGDRPFQCDKCEKSFTTAGNLKNHARVHSGERPFECTEKDCGLRFAEISTLKKHKLTHTGQKPFKCEECGRSFTQSGSRRIHMKKHLLDKEIDELEEEDEDNDPVKEMVSGQLNKFQNMVVVHSGTQDDIMQYQDLQVVFSQGVSDHVVTVTTQPADVDQEFPPIANEMLLSGGILHQEDLLQPKTSNKSSANVVVLSQPPVMVPMTSDFHDSPREEIVYGTEFLHADLDHEEIAHNITDSQTVQDITGNPHSLQ